MSESEAPYEAERVDSTMAVIVAFERTGDPIEINTGDGIREIVVGDLLVVFKTGEVWRYTGITRDTYEAIWRARSVGRAINRLAKNRRAVREGRA